MVGGAVCCTTRNAATSRAEQGPGCMVALSHACEHHLGAGLPSKQAPGAGKEQSYASVQHQGWSGSAAAP